MQSKTIAKQQERSPIAQQPTAPIANRTTILSPDHEAIRIGGARSNGHVEGMNRFIRDTTVKRFHYDSHAQFRRLLDELGSAGSATTSICCAPHTPPIHKQEMDGRFGPLPYRSAPPRVGTERAPPRRHPNKIQPTRE